jgi:hypothetical protein
LATRPEAESIVFGDHVERRIAQRGIPADVVKYTISRGERYHFRGGEWYRLRRRDIQPADRPRYERFAGVTVLMAPDAPVVITVFRREKCRRDLVVWDKR